MRAGPKQDTNTKRGRVRQQRPINKIMSAGIYTSGIPTAQTHDLSTKVGLWHPSEKGQYKMIGRTKEVAKHVGEEELRGNTKKHNTAVRTMDDYEGDHVSMDEKGNWHSIARAPLITDDNGDKRAYGQIIAG